MTSAPADIPPYLAGAVLTIDLAAVQKNYRSLAQAAAPARCGAAVKANCYGLGLAPVSRALWAAGCRDFFVARPMEGVELRRILPQATIFVLDGLLRGQAGFYARHALVPALISAEEAREWAACAAAAGRKLDTAFHVDTGINRLGMTAAELASVKASTQVMENLKPVLLMSHLACSDDPAHPHNAWQQAAFAEIRAGWPGVPASLANSSGIYLGQAYACDVVRPGIALYGGNPTSGHPNPMQTVATLAATILHTRDLKPGETVGYSATWRAIRPSRIAILGAGYNDGIPRSLSSKGDATAAHVLIAGAPCPIIGRVSMDVMAVDVTDLPAAQGLRGDCAEIFGPHLALDQVAGWAGTISYELLTRLGSRYARVYSGVDSGVAA
jgi:alanine racemase